jgi:hypothetical protein
MLAHVPFVSAFVYQVFGLGSTLFAPGKWVEWQAWNPGPFSSYRFVAWAGPQDEKHVLIVTEKSIL